MADLDTSAERLVPTPATLSSLYRQALHIRSRSLPEPLEMKMGIGISKMMNVGRKDGLRMDGEC